MIIIIILIIMRLLKPKIRMRSIYPLVEAAENVLPVVLSPTNSLPPRKEYLSKKAS